MSYTRKLWAGVVVATAISSLVAAGGVAVAQKGKPKKPAANVDVTAARSALASNDPEQAVAAARRLGQTRAPAALDALLDALALGLNPTVATAALDAVGEHGSVKSFDVVAYYLHYRNGKVRAAAVRAMGHIDDSRANPLVLGALHDWDDSVRAAAAEVVSTRKVRAGIELLFELLKKGDEAAAPALASLANPDLARALAELIGVAPDGLLARCLGAILIRADFGPEAARVQVVRALGKIPGNDALEQLTTYVATVPEKPPRQSRREAEAIIEARLSEGG